MYIVYLLCDRTCWPQSRDPKGGKTPDWQHTKTHTHTHCHKIIVSLPESALWVVVAAVSPSSLSLWFILPDASTHPANPDCEESGDSSSSGSSELEPSGRQLFCLEYEADSGEVTSVIVYQVCLVKTAASRRSWAVLKITVKKPRATVTSGPVGSICST
jgi:hypothetical protein